MALAGLGLFMAKDAARVVEPQRQRAVVQTSTDQSGGQRRHIRPEGDDVTLAVEKAEHLALKIR